jgi:methionyl-tRNA formyltransferase
MRIIIATIKPWNISNAQKFKQNNQHETMVITDKEKLTFEDILKLNPDYIFFPHWSWIITKKIHENYKCIVFHMTDLPFGRGGSPLQNLISRGIDKTKISAIKVDSGIDTGDVYLKKDLNLNGTAEEIFMRASDIIFNEIIPEILTGIKPVKQEGQIREFKRLNDNDGQILESFDLNRIYDYIRMLDAEGYPKAFINFGGYRLKLSRASLKHGRILADVEIIGGEYE